MYSSDEFSVKMEYLFLVFNLRAYLNNFLCILFVKIELYYTVFFFFLLENYMLRVLKNKRIQEFILTISCYDYLQDKSLIQEVQVVAVLV